MTSKEYIKGVLYNLEEALKLAKENNDKDLENDCKMQKEAYTQVLKDLEKLEILKRIIKVRPSEIYEFTLVVRGTDEEEDIIKEWLENDKNNL